MRLLLTRPHFAIFSHFLLFKAGLYTDSSLGHSNTYFHFRCTTDTSLSVCLNVGLSVGVGVFAVHLFTTSRPRLCSYLTGYTCSLVIISRVAGVPSLALAIHWVASVRSVSPPVHFTFNYDSHLCAFLFAGLQVFAVYLSTCPLAFSYDSLPLHLSIGF